MSQYISKIRTNEGDKQIDYNALANLPTISNPNLLINGDFRVNQRGQKVYEFISGWTYTVDRWRIFRDMTVTVNDTGTITLAKNNSEQAYFMQALERRDVVGEYTLSFKVKSITGTMSAYIEDGDSDLITVTQAGIYVIYSFNRANGATFRLEGTNTSVELEWVKLEAGHTATPFVPRLYAEELMLCRRYFCVIAPSGMIISRQRFDGVTSYYAGFPFPNVMRTGPGVTYESKTSDSSEILTGRLGLTHDEFCAKYFSIEGDYDDVELTYMSLDAEIY